MLWVNVCSNNYLTFPNTKNGRLNNGSAIFLNTLEG